MMPFEYSYNIINEHFGISFYLGLYLHGQTDI